jgi:hypothetical protein
MGTVLLLVFEHAVDIFFAINFVLEKKSMTRTKLFLAKEVSCCEQVVNLLLRRMHGIYTIVLHD